MIIGGLQPNASKLDCDVPAIGGQHNMFLGQENVDYQDTGGKSNWWHSPLDNVTGYRVPDQIISVIGGEYGPMALYTLCIKLTCVALAVTLPLRHPLLLGRPTTFPDCLDVHTWPSHDR